MYHLDNTSGVPEMPEPKDEQSISPRWFGESQEQGGISWPGADWFNTVQAELLNLIAAAGLTPEKRSFDQLSKAIPVIGDEQLRRTLGSTEEGNGDAIITHIRAGIFTGKLREYLGASVIFVTPEMFYHLNTDDNDHSPAWQAAINTGLPVHVNGVAYNVGDLQIPQGVSIVVSACSTVTKKADSACLATFEGGNSFFPAKWTGGILKGNGREIVSEVCFDNQSYRTEIKGFRAEGFYQFFRNIVNVSDYDISGMIYQCYYGIYNTAGGINAKIDCYISQTYGGIYVNNTGATTAAEGMVLKGQVTHCGDAELQMHAVTLVRATYSKTVSLMVDQSYFTPIYIRSSQRVTVDKGSYAAANNAPSGVHGIECIGNCEGTSIDGSIEYCPSGGLYIDGNGATSYPVYLNGVRFKNNSQIDASPDVYSAYTPVIAVGVISLSSTASFRLVSGASLTWTGGQASAYPSVDSTSLVISISGVRGINNMITGTCYGTVSKDGSLSSAYGVTSVSYAATGVYTINYSTSQAGKAKPPRVYISPRFSGGAISYSITTKNNTGFVVKFFSYDSAGIATDFDFEVFG